MTDRIAEVLASFDRVGEQFFSRVELQARLRSGRKLRIKYSVDAAAPGLHIGHAVNLWLMRALQDLGHCAVFVIGDDTARGGDPDGFASGHRAVPEEDIERSALALEKQAKTILHADDPALLEVHRNSEWLTKMTALDVMGLMAQVTQARLIVQEKFQHRIATRREIQMNEMVHPVLQAYDSVAMAADIALAGEDHLFRERLGRFLQERAGMRPQVIVTTRVIAGIDGKNKPSKNLGNDIGLDHGPREKFKRILQVQDAQVEEYLRLYTDLPESSLAEMKTLAEKRPREAKLNLAQEIVARHHGRKVSVWEREWFENTVLKGEAPEEMPTLPVIAEHMTAEALVALTRPGAGQGSIRRLILEGGMTLNGAVPVDADVVLALRTNDVLKVGKRDWFRIEVVLPAETDMELLRLKRLETEDLGLLQKFLPEWEIVKYLSRPGVVKDGLDKRIAKNILSRVILQPAPKKDLLLKITPQAAPQTLAGLAHVRRDEGAGSKNTGTASLWMTPAFSGIPYLKEALAGINKQALGGMGLERVVFKNAFTHVSGGNEPEKGRISLVNKPADPKPGPSGSGG